MVSGVVPFILNSKMNQVIQGKQKKKFSKFNFNNNKLKIIKFNLHINGDINQIELCIEILTITTKSRREIQS